MPEILDVLLEAHPEMALRGSYWDEAWSEEEVRLFEHALGVNASPEALPF